MRKSKYTDDFPLLAEGYARQGFTDDQIAGKLGISTQTFYNYKDKYVEFFEAIKRGKAPVDTMVENAMLKRALGYEYEETHIEVDALGREKTKIVTKQVIPDTTAQIFWLKNRQPAAWRDKQHIEHSGTITHREELIKELSKLPAEELKKIAFSDN